MEEKTALEPRLFVAPAVGELGDCKPSAGQESHRPGTAEWLSSVQLDLLNMGYPSNCAGPDRAFSEGCVELAKTGYDPRISLVQIRISVAQVKSRQSDASLDHLLTVDDTHPLEGSGVAHRG